jgi:hypothetical protein
MVGLVFVYRILVNSERDSTGSLILDSFDVIGDFSTA